MGMRPGYKQTAEHVRRRMESAAKHRVSKKPVSREWLEQKYVNEKLDCVQVGKLVERDPKSVWNWLKDFGIPTRPRGANARVWFTTGRPHGYHHSPETRKKLSAIAKADGRVPYDPAVGPYMKGRSGAKHPNWQGGVTPERQAFYCSRAWKEACKAVWARSNATCERCGLRHNGTPNRGTFHIHHIVGFATREFRAEPSNLALLCSRCHRFIHSKANISREFREAL